MDHPHLPDISACVTAHIWLVMHIDIYGHPQEHPHGHAHGPDVQVQAPMVVWDHGRR